MATNDALLDYLENYDKHSGDNPEAAGAGASIDELGDKGNRAETAKDESKRTPVSVKEDNFQDRKPISAKKGSKTDKVGTPNKGKSKQVKKQDRKQVSVNSRDKTSTPALPTTKGKTLIFNVHNVSQEQKERETIENELKELDKLLDMEEAEKAQFSPIDSTNSTNSGGVSIDEFLAESKEIWAAKQADSGNKPIEKTGAPTAPTKKVEAVVDNSVDKFLAETRAEWARSGQTNAAPTATPAPDIQQPEVAERRINYELDKGASVTDLMQRAKTHFHELWLETYEKAQRSRKDTEQARKLKNGLFRYNKDGELELLPDVRIDDKTADDLLEVKWI